MPLERNIRVPDGIHPLVESMKMTRLHPSLDGPVGVTQPPKLANRDHAMLPICQCR
jgi:hypothetical protein